MKFNFSDVICDLFEGTDESRNMNTLVDMISGMEGKADDDDFMNAVEQEPLPLGKSAEHQHRQNFIQSFPLAGQFLRRGAVWQTALGGHKKRRRLFSKSAALAGA